ncbi:AI-2E family transporter [Halopiger djelfimassiliensis]|uniref:AI-2E family transporter n=1 Tax=Halopiger djelfimassiliensis TaxID=1293047 RepID=UPI000677A5A8|nr:AI-2E family transporter [Halopiger djelfimassiliensis]
MSDRTDGNGWISQRTGLTALTVVSVVLGTLVVLPYLQYVLLGVVLAYILLPAQRRLERYVRPMIAAMTLVVGTVLVILIPILYVLAIALQQALEVGNAVQEGTLDIETIEAGLRDTGYAVDLDNLYETYQDPIATGLQGLATSAIDFVSGLPGILIGLTVTLFVLFALLRDGEQLVAWLRTVIPVRADLQRELIEELDQLMWASVVGNVAVAAIQAVLLGIGLALLGVPAVVFLTVATFVLALLPLVGAFGVWVPVTGYLVMVGRPVPAAVLFVYGSLVSASDTYLRPALIGRTSAFNAAIVVVGIFGGIVVFGAVGLFIGPVVLGGAKITLDVFARERGLETAPLEETEPAADAATDTDPETGITADADRDDEPTADTAGDEPDTVTETPSEPDAETEPDPDADTDPTA